ncbi:MAG: DUF3006 domain-containing protein [Candidatus Paceibacterota bacterium]
MKKAVLKVVIDRFEGDYAVLRYEKDEILWPKKQLPTEAHEGGSLVLSAMTDKDAEKERGELAKAILNELLKKE